LDARVGKGWFRLMARHVTATLGNVTRHDTDNENVQALNSRWNGESDMTESTENLVLEIMRQMRGDITSLRNEMRDGLGRIELRLGLVEQALAGLLGVSASDRDEIRALKSRVEHIERRLELTE